jgi:tryptophan synthase beta chain
MELAAGRSPQEVIVVCLSGRGDKDAAEIGRLRAPDAGQRLAGQS